jgi:hypothetical protein
MASMRQRGGKSRRGHDCGCTNVVATMDQLQEALTCHSLHRQLPTGCLSDQGADQVAFPTGNIANSF